MSKDKAAALAKAAEAGILLAHAHVEYTERRKQFWAAVDEVGKVNVAEGLV